MMLLSTRTDGKTDACAREAGCSLVCLRCLMPVLMHAENPQDINAVMERLGFGAGGGGFGGPAALGGGLPPVADPETAYATQLEQLQVLP